MKEHIQRITRLVEERQDAAEIKRLARIARIAMVRELSNQGCNNVYIAKLLGISENSVRRIRKDLEADR